MKHVISSLNSRTPKSRSLPLLLVIVLMIVMSGCNKTFVAASGEQNKIINSSKNKISTLNSRELAKLCQSYQLNLNFIKFNQCFLTFMSKYKNKHTSAFDLLTSMPINKDISWLKYDVLISKAVMEFHLSNYRSSLKYIDLATESLDETGDNFIAQIKARPSYFSSMGYGPLALGGIIAARLHDNKKAMNFINQIDQVHGFMLFQSEISYLKSIAKAQIYFELGKYGQAKRLFDEKGSSGIRTFNTAFLGTEYERIMAVENMEIRYLEGLVNMNVANVNVARKQFDEILSNKHVLSLGSTYWQLLFHRARIYMMDEHYTKAINKLISAVQYIEKQRSTITVDGSKIGFIGDRQAVYSLLVKALMNQHRYDEAFAYAERGKARALVDMLASKKQFNGGDSTNIAEQHQLIAQLDMAEAKARVMSDPKTLSTTRSIAIKARTAIIQQAPELSSLVTVSAPDVKEIQSLLPKGETLIEYYGSGDDLFAFVVTSGGIRGVNLDGKGLADDVSAFRAAILSPKSNAYQWSGNKLYNRLITPIASGIHTKNLTIVAHGALHYLPFSALTANNQFLIDQYNIRILPSASVMKFLKKNNNKAGSLLAFGNPDLGEAKYDLPFAQKEAEMIVRKTAGAKLLVRGQATETAVKSYGNSFRYLHFASHGTFDAEKPLQSGLLLAKDDQNDGMLTVGELYDLKLNADLVTLSACETALGKVANGDDVVGFTRGFLYAGASSIVSSLWQVDDAATSDLMTSFYANLGKENKRSALRDAQLATKAKYHHPYYWAAFQITGAVQ